jgi:hypothetical protein
MPTYHEFEVSLREIKPRIWRRFLFKRDGRFSELSEAIQDAFGWLGFHLWEFRLAPHGAPIAGVPPEDGDDWGTPAPDAKEVELSSVFGGTESAVCFYEYDFGDGWSHKVERKRVVELDETFERRLLAGRRNRPPEDCGGPPGYEAIVAFLKGDFDEEQAIFDQEVVEQYVDYNPDEFDLREAKEGFDR